LARRGQRQGQGQSQGQIQEAEARRQERRQEEVGRQANQARLTGVHPVVRDKVRLFTRGLVTLFALVTVLSVTSVAPAADPIQPGDFMATSVGGCTFSFVFDGGGVTYLATAAHCVEKVGNKVSLEDGTVVGHAAVIGNADHAANDWALIAIDAPYVSR